jgi:MshEN domain
MTSTYDHAEAMTVLDALEKLAAQRRNVVRGAQHSGRLLGNLLVNRGFLTGEELEVTLRQQRRTGERLGEAAVRLGYITDRALADVLAEQLRLPVVDLRRTEIDIAIATLLPYEDTVRSHMLPFRLSRDGIDIAAVDPTDEQAITAIVRRIRFPILFHVASVSDVELAVRRIWS